MRGIRLDLLAEASHVHGDGGQVAVAPPPHGAQEFLAREPAPGRRARYASRSNSRAVRERGAPA